MSKREKLWRRICELDKSLRFEELEKVLEYFGYSCDFPGGGSSHCTFRKPGCVPITIPTHEPVPRVYVQMVKEVLEKEGVI